MSLVSHRMVRNEHGAERTIALMACDGPRCGSQVESDRPAYGTLWAVLTLGPDDDDAPLSANYHFCGWRCLASFVLAEVADRRGE